MNGDHEVSDEGGGVRPDGDGPAASGGGGDRAAGDVSTVALHPGTPAPARPVLSTRPPAIEQGFRIGEYVVESELGRGAFGTVYAGIQPVIGKRVAIKVLNPLYSVEPAFVSRFVEEARAVNKIGHANIVDIFSFGELEDGRRYFVMERLDGRPLSSLLKERRQLSPLETLEILGPVGRALAAAHAAGIAHRDLKPDNIFLGRGEEGGWRPKLLDFGVAKLLDESPSAHATASGVTVGTPSYMSPEQCVGKGVDHRADVYAFGVLAYRMLTGALPYDADSASMMMAKHLYEEPRPPLEARADLPPAVGDVLLWMLRKDKLARPQSVLEAYAALEGAVRGTAAASTPSGVVVPVAPASVTPVAEARPPSGRRGPLPILVGLAAAAAAVIAVVALVSRSGAPTPAARATPPIAAAQPPAPLPSPPSLAERARATAPPPEPARVRLELRGIPADTSVRDEHGALLRTGPGVVELARSSEPRRLSLDAPEHERRVETIVADRDLTVDIAMAPSPRRTRRPAPAKPAGAEHAPRPNDLEPWR